MKRKLETWKRKLQFCTQGGLLIAAAAALGLTTLAQGGDPCNDPDAIITVEILTDNFGNETTWEVVEQGVGVIASGGPYPNTTLITVDVPVCSTSCYDFTIFDAFGDGICCGYGKGFYNVFYEGGLVCSGGTFKFEETCPNIGASCGGGDGCNDPDIVLTVEILTDNFGNETTFEVVEEGVGVILSGGPFPDNTLIIEEVDICSDKCYNFTIFDAFGDGICCGYGNGFYNIFVDGALVCSGGEFEDEETCFDLNGLGDCEGPPPPPENDNCEDATPLEVPSSVSGSTFNASPDEPPAFFCGTSVGAPGVWYSVIGTGTTMTATTCTDFFGYDTKLSVFCGDCSDGLTCVGGNDDNCSGGGSSLLSTVEWCSQAGAEYLILVHGFAGQVGDFDLEVSEDGVGCAADVLCLPQGACCFDDGSCLVTTEDDCAAQGGEYQGDDTQCFNPAGNPEVTVSNPNLDIPDNDPVGVSDTIVIPDADGVTIGDVDVDVVINHTWIGDLVITLEHNATVVTLWDRACGSENDMDVIFDDEGNPLFCAEPTTGNITPLSADGDALSLFDGQSSAGAWTITVTDNAGADLGTLLQWSLHLDEGVPKCEVPPTGASLDIKPGSCPNSFNRNSNGVLPVALVGTDDFDVTEVDISSILLARTDGGGGSIAPHEGPPGPHSVFEDVATPFEGEEQCDCHEFEGDGVLDLSLKFKSSDLVDALGLDDLKAGELVSLTLTGSLLDGTPFEADDCIRIVPPGELPGMMAMGSTAPGVFIDVTPLDETLDGGGFVDFKRTYLLGTIVTITAPPTHPGWVFVGWDFDDGGLSSFTVTRQGGFGLQPDDRTIEIIVLDEFSLKAIYRPTMYLP